MTRFAAALAGALAAGLAVAELALPTPAWAEDAAAAQPPADDQRYSFHRSGEGFVRLDSRTGQVARCGWGAGGWACTVVPDERAALESEIARLQAENAALKKELLSRGLDLPEAARGEGDRRGAPEARPAPQPSETEIDRAIAFVKGVWRKLLEMMADLQRDIQRKS